MSQKIKEDDFYTNFKPQTNHIIRTGVDKNIADADICSFGGTMYETFGKEEEHIREVIKTKPRTVWTILDVDDELIITAGFHYVNRFGYIITEKEWTTGEEEVEND